MHQQPPPVESSRGPVANGNGASALLLGVPALSLALAITTVSALVPLKLQTLAASPLVIGVVVAGEGLIALFLPVWIGRLSDRTRSPFGGRLPYMVAGTGRTTAAASGLMAIVAVVAVVAAPLAGWLGDRFGPLRVMRLALSVYSLGLLLPCFTESLWVLIPVMPLVGFGGTVVMTLPYTLVAQATPGQSPGAIAGWYELSRGVGVIAGPIVTGAAIDVLEPLFASTQGYAAMWLVQGLSLLLSLPLLPRSPARKH